MRIAFVGLGAMGAPMARRLLAAGHAVAVVDVRPEAVARLAAEGARPAASPAAAAGGAEVAVVMVMTGGQAESVLVGEDGLLAALGPGATAVVMSTIGPAAARRLAEACRARSVGYVDAPVTGGVAAAEAGSLAAIIGGEPAVVERVRPLLGLLCRELYQVGPNPGDGQAVKLVNQLLVGVTCAAVGEALALAEGAGLDTGLLLEVLTHGAADSWVLRNFGASAVAGRRDRQDILPILAKDLGLVVGRAVELGVPLPVAGAAFARLLDVAADGAEGASLRAVARVLAHEGGGRRR
jgi:3-hydroxyisobutyrate dehydrogenase-like beta-hydroxyacid dehydrogenase